MIFLLVTFSVAALVGYWGVFDLAPAILHSLGLLASILLTPVLFTAGMAIYTPLAVAGAVMAKRILIGQGTGRCYGLWSGKFLCPQLDGAAGSPRHSVVATWKARASRT